MRRRSEQRCAKGEKETRGVGGRGKAKGVGGKSEAVKVLCAMETTLARYIPPIYPDI